MDLGTQPHVLEDLTQVEEMLIACASPILQVMHSIGGQYKYQGHTISFTQEIKDVFKTFPWHINNLDLMVIVRKKDDKDPVMISLLENKELWMHYYIKFIMIHINEMFEWILTQ